MKNIQEIIRIVSRETGVSALDIANPSRCGKIILARHLSMWACRWYTKSSLQMISAAHGKKSHGTVMNACASIDAQITYNSRIKSLCEKIVKTIKHLS